MEVVLYLRIRFFIPAFNVSLELILYMISKSNENLSSTFLSFMIQGDAYLMLKLLLMLLDSLTVL